MTWTSISTLSTMRRKCPMLTMRLIQVFINTPTDSGSFWHVLFGIASSFMPDQYPLVTSIMFAGYEVSKLASGESAQRVAGSLMEFGFGVGMGIFAYREGMVKR